MLFEDAKFEVFTAVKIQAEEFCVVMPCNVVGGYRCFRGPFCLQIPDDRGNEDL
jgi:hypothetical protein